MKAKDRELRVERSLEFTRSDALIFEPPFPVWKILVFPRSAQSLLSKERIAEGVVSRCFAEVHSNILDMPDFLVVKTERKRKTEEEEEEGETRDQPIRGFSTIPATRARHINSNGKRIKPPHFLTRARSPLFSPNVKSFQRTFVEGDPLRYIVLNATALARYTYARNSSLQADTQKFSGPCII